MDKNSNQPEQPSWLEELQQRSWEPEVLLSGIVLYGMFQTPDLLDSLLIFFKANILGVSSDIDTLVAILKLGIYWLIFGLILHLISRGIWVGMVGLSYTFPKGINSEKLKFKERFKTKVENISSFQAIIIKLEEICSTLFSISFMLFMSVIGAYLYLFVLVIIPFFLLILVFGYSFNRMPAIWEFYSIAIMIIGFIGLLDFLTLGYFKRFKWVAKLFWPFAQLISFITLSRFYRPIYYAFVSNYNRWVIMGILVVFTLTSLFSLNSLSSAGYAGDGVSRIALWGNSPSTSAFSGYYEDQNSGWYSVQAQIPSDIIDGNVLRLFIPADIEKEDSIRMYSNYDSLAKSTPPQKMAQLSLEVTKKFYHVYLNDSLLNNLPWYFHYKTSTRQRGFLTYVDIRNLDQGIHTIGITGPPAMYKSNWATIPFYREIRDAGARHQSVEPQRETDYMDLKPLLPK